MRIAVSALVGFVFGIGLLISGMGNPAKVLNFLDVSGTWDPSLAFVMGGAIAVTLPGYRVLKGRDKPLFANVFQWPQNTAVDRRLLGGAVLFGVGWGIGGFCPGPALVAAPLMAPGALVFLVCMLGGLAIARRFSG